MLYFLQEEVFVAEVTLLPRGGGRNGFEDDRVTGRGTVYVDRGSVPSGEQPQGRSGLTEGSCCRCGRVGGSHACGKVSIILN